MLSAIAARKLAQAQKESGISPINVVTLPPAAFPTAPSRPLMKRKPSPAPPNPPRKKQKKKKKARRVEETRTRYFEEQPIALEREEDIIILDSDEQDISEDEFDPPTLPIKVSKGKRAWSPSMPLNDSSNEEEEDEVATVPVPEPAILSSFVSIPGENLFFLTPEESTSLGLSLHEGESASVISLAPSQTISFLGTYTFVVLRGSVSISGVNLTASPTRHRVFAPRSSPIPVLAHLSGDASRSHRKKADLSDRLHVLLNQERAIIVLQELRTGVEGLGRICRTFDGFFDPSRWQKSDIQPEFSLRGTHMLTRQSKNIQPFVVPPTWESALSSISCEGSNVYLVRGPKKSGKSTFARTLLNRLTTRYRKVAFLECDLGQSEFTPGGMVALNIIETPVFGPPFTHPTLPKFAHYVGATTPRSSPSHYISSLQSIMESYRLDVQSPLVDAHDNDERISDTIPLVVNTMGWIKGLGADLTRKIEDIVEPTDIFEIEAPSFDSGWSGATLPKNPVTNYGKDTKMHTLEPIIPSTLSTNYSAADHRSLSILSYLHAVFPPPSTSPAELQQITATSWNTDLPLCARPPFEVNWETAFDKFVLAGAGTEDVVPSEIEHVLNGAIVGLVSCDPGTLDLDSDIDMATPNGHRCAIPYTQGSSVPSPLTSTCHGLALIRSISPTSPHLQIITPLGPQLLAKCRVAVKGEMELPIWGMLDITAEEGVVAGFERYRAPYLQWGKGEGLGGERRRVRRNLMRKGQM